MGIEWSHSGALICLMAGSTYTDICVKIYKILVKKGAGTAAIFEGVGISAPLMGRYVGRACWYGMVT